MISRHYSHLKIASISLLFGNNFQSAIAIQLNGSEIFPIEVSRSAALMSISFYLVLDGKKY